MSRKECCSNILMESDSETHKIQGERFGFYTQLGMYGGRPAYRQDGGSYFLFYLEDEQKWIDSLFFYGATLFTKLVNDMDGYCLDEHSNWSLFNKSTLMYSDSLVTSCSKITDVCCSEIKISSVNSNNQSFYDEQPRESLGVYKAIGMINGRYVYQKNNHDRFLEYGDRYWLVSTGVGKGSGHIHHPGGSVCPEHIKSEWQIADKDDDDNWLWKDDPELEITCVNPTGSVPGVIAQPYIQAVPIPTEGTYNSTAVFFGCLTVLLLAMMCAYFGRRGYRAWGRGAHGKNLVFETFDLPQ